MIRALVLVGALVACHHSTRPREKPSVIGEDTILPGVGGLCANDGDCALVAGCCGCDGGGTLRAIRKAEVEHFNAVKATECHAGQCPDTRSEDLSCLATARCEQSRCRMVVNSSRPSPPSGAVLEFGNDDLARSVALVLALVACSHPRVQRFDPPPRRHSHIESDTLLPGIGGLCASDAECALVTDCCGCSEGGHAAPIRAVEVPRHDEIKARECAHTACSDGPGKAQSCRAMPVCRQGRCRLLATRVDELDEGDPGPK